MARRKETKTAREQFGDSLTIESAVYWLGEWMTPDMKPNERNRLMNKSLEIADQFRQIVTAKGLTP